MIKTHQRTVTKEQHGFCLILLAFLCLLMPSCHKKLSPSIQSAHQMLWTDAESSYQQLLNIEESQLNYLDQAYYRVCYEHANLRTNLQVDSIQLLLQAAEILEEHQHYNIAGEAYYVIGSYISLSNYFDATYYLKQAKYYLELSSEFDKNMLGIVYYRLGDISSHERMFEVANSYFYQAIPYLDDNILFKACAYRDYAKSLHDDSIEVAITYLDSALNFAQQLPDSSFIIEIESMKLSILKESPFELLNKQKKLCNQYRRYMYGGHIAEYYLSRNQLDSAEVYINILSKDTLYNVWSKEHYYSLKSQVLAARGQYKQALEILSSLHDWQTTEIENTAYARAYTIAQRFDVEKERERNLKLQLDKQIMLIYIVLLILLILIGIIITLVWHYRNQHKLALKEAEMQRLIISNQKKQITLHHKIREILIHQRLDGINGKQNQTQIRDPINELYTDVDVIYESALTNIKKQYPALTQTDMMVIALMFLDLSIEDCCLLLNMTKESMWVRRKRIKQHLGLSADTNLDEWILEQQKKA